MEGSLRPLARSFVTNQLFEEAGASAADVLGLSEQIAARVEERFGVRLEREPVLLG